MSVSFVFWPIFIVENLDMRKIVFVTTFLFSFSVIHSQDSLTVSQIDTALTNEDSFVSKNEARIYLQTGNNIVQLGRTLPSNAIYLRPSFMYYHKSGLYFGANLTILPNEKKRPLDNFLLNVGYDKDLGKNFMTGIDYSYSHYFTSKQVSSSASHMIRPYISWDNDYASPTFTPIISVGTSVDYSFQFDLTHIFTIRRIFSGRDKLTIPLIVGAIAGTSNYYTTYKKNNQLASNSSTSKFAMTSIYFLATAKYRINRVSLSFNTSYYLSVDPTQTTTSSNTPFYKLTLCYYI